MVEVATHLGLDELEVVTPETMALEVPRLTTSIFK